MQRSDVNAVNGFLLNRTDRDFAQDARGEICVKMPVKDKDGFIRGTDKAKT